MNTQHTSKHVDKVKQIYVMKETHNRLAALCAANGQKLVWAANRALLDYLEKNEKKSSLRP